MSTFAKQTFDATIYAASRPTYPKALFDYIFAYHGTGIPPNVKALSPERTAKGRVVASPRWEQAVDLGCGTGQATTELTRFKKVIGIEPGEKMISSAKSHILDTLGKDALAQFTFVQSAAEKLDCLEDQSTDMVIAAQACHWFDWSKLWPELSRVIRPGGTGAFWVYSEFRLTKYPSLTPLISEFMQGEDPATSLGPHWQRPGRTILENHLVDVPAPPTDLGFGEMDRIYFTGAYHSGFPRANVFPVILRNATTWGGLLGYLRTASSLHTFHERYPEDLQRTDGDISERFWKALMKSASEVDGKEYQAQDKLMVDWPVALLLVKKL
ncbi:S-adenosyl-L-methionine-dependent methyltransferase [Hymenopellis radicata]|nr:S-adenosyl-L-methionine-dependent methyltransferase [Hymenopellis radicata]